MYLKYLGRSERIHFFVVVVRQALHVRAQGTEEDNGEESRNMRRVESRGEEMRRGGERGEEERERRGGEEMRRRERGGRGREGMRGCDGEVGGGDIVVWSRVSSGWGMRSEGQNPQDREAIAFSGVSILGNFVLTL
eukprot:764177-Hanusia_phi.AAC.2